MENCRAYYFDDDASVLPRSIATRQAMLNAMTLDIAMGGSTNTVLHLLAVANEAGVDFTMNDIDVLSRKTPVLCKVAPNSKYHIEDVNRAGGIPSIMGILADNGLVDTSCRRVDGLTLGEEIEKYAIGGKAFGADAEALWKSAPCGKRTTALGSQRLHLFLARRRPRQRMYPRFRPRLRERRRTCRAYRQHSLRRLRGENRRRR